MLIITQKLQKLREFQKCPKFEPFTKRFLFFIAIWSTFDSYLQDLLLISGGCAVWNVHFFELFLMIYSFGNASYSGIQLWFSLLIYLWESSLNISWFFLESSDPGIFLTGCESISFKLWTSKYTNLLQEILVVTCFVSLFFIISLCPLKSSVWFSIIAC